jgi:ADP-heptose:LPS heptosyltransferase
VLAAVSPDGPAPRGVDLPVIRDDHFLSRHMVEQIALLLAPLGIHEAPPPLTLHSDAAATKSMAEALRRLSPTPTAPCLGIHISARKSKQRWPSKRFPELMASLHAATGCTFALFWAPGAADDPQHPGDDEKARAIIEASDGLPIRPLPTHTLEELIAGLGAVDALICSDGGAMHLAAALGKPIVSFFGNSDPQTWRPWGVPHRVLRPASEDVTDVTVEETCGAVLELLASCRLIAAI